MKQPPSPTPIPCPHCGKKIESRKNGCPHCGYRGYVPLTEAEIKRTKLILYPIFIVIALLAILLLPKLFGG